MEQDKEMQYAYDMVITIVAEMVVEYLKDNDRQESKNDTVATDVNFEGKEGHVSKIEPEKTAA